MVTVKRLLDFCADIEFRNARIYADFMFRLGSDDDRVAQFWEDMSAAEWEHYVTVSFGRSLCERAEMQNNVVPDLTEESLKRVEEVLTGNESRIAEARYTLQDAFQMAIDFESSEADAIYLGLISIIKRAIERLGERHLLRRIERMESKVTAHLDGLAKAIMRLGNSPDLVRQARRLLDSTR